MQSRIQDQVQKTTQASSHCRQRLQEIPFGPMRRVEAGESPERVNSRLIRRLQKLP